MHRLAITPFRKRNVQPYVSPSAADGISTWSGRGKSMFSSWLDGHRGLRLQHRRPPPPAKTIGRIRSSRTARKYSTMPGQTSSLDRAVKDIVLYACINHTYVVEYPSLFMRAKESGGSSIRRFKMFTQASKQGWKAGEKETVSAWTSSLTPGVSGECRIVSTTVAPCLGFPESRSRFWAWCEVLMH